MQRNRLLTDLRRIAGSANVLATDAGLRVYESDALSVYRQKPLAVVLPDSTEMVARLLAYCFDHGVKIVPRGAGTSLSGGALPVADGIVIGLGKMNRILEIDLANLCMRVEPGVTNLAISQAVAKAGYYYAPDPSSQLACTIGGNVAENAGGIHCLKYGVTGNNILGLTWVTPEGRIEQLGGKFLESPGFDLMGLLTGSEGLLGMITEIIVKLRPKPETARAFLAAFPAVERAGQAVSVVLNAGIIPAGMEIMDKISVEAIEAFIPCGYPKECEALLILELDGIEAEIEGQTQQILKLLHQLGVTSVTVSGSEAERVRIWAGRKAAFPAVGRLAPDYFCMDGTIPRRELPGMLKHIGALSKEYGLAIANVFHAGDGNLHPLIMFDANIPGELDKAEKVGAAILRHCVALGGVLSGEHGIGVEKRDLMDVQFSQQDLDQQMRIKCIFDPKELLNPGKVFPTLAKCADRGWARMQSAQPHSAEMPSF